MSVKASVSGSIFSRIVNTGLHQSLPKYLERRLQPTNIVSLVIFGIVGIPFSIITYIYFPSLVWYPSVGGLLCGGVVVLNYYGFIKYSRIIVALVPIILGAIYNASLSDMDEDPLPSVYLLELGFSLIPFVVFDIKERWAIFFSVFCCIIIISTFPITKNWFHSGYDSFILRSGWLSSVTILLAILTQLSCVLGLVAIGRKAEKESDESRKLAEEEKRKLELEKEENVKKTEELSKKQTEEKKRQWANEGITLVSKVIRETQEGEKLYDKIIATVVKYLHANQGGLFLVERENDNTEIILKACYAYGKKKHAEKTILPGQGIIGQAYLERQSVYLTQVPQNYVNITSGLGEATPTALLVIPLIVNDTVQGLLELASFQKIDSFEIDFLEKLAEIIAAHINNQRVVEQTQRLLKQSQEQSEEMRAQEEEMRQNMEELGATQEEMHRKSVEMENRIQAINASGVASIEFEMDGTIITANDAFLCLMGYTLNEVRGKHHSIFVKPEFVTSEGYREMWEALRRGETHNGEFERITKSGKPVYIKGAYSCMHDIHGKPVRVIKMAIDITRATKTIMKVNQ